MAAGGREIEIKLRVSDIAALRKLLRRIGAKPQPRMFERNVLYDTAGGELQRTGQLLRIRVEVPAARGTVRPRIAPLTSAESRSERRRMAWRGILTYKAPLESENGAAVRSPYKERREIEVQFQPVEQMEAIIEALGYRPGFIYEKFRQTYRHPRFAGLHFDLDETPLGSFLELEGTPPEIDAAAQLLHFTTGDYVTATYWDLHVADCRGRKAAPGHLIFARPRK
jgi:adenylate cyclase class 2